MSHRVLVPMDGSPLAQRALRYALDSFPDAAITAIHVIDPVASVTASEAEGLSGAEEWHENAQNRASAILERAGDIAAESDVELATATEVGRPARTILDYADEHDIDQIVIGSHGRKGLERAIFGSVAESVARRGRQPVTIVR